MIYFLSYSMKEMEKPLLISLIVVLGLILYVKLLRSLKKKRLENTYVSIDGYDIINEQLEIRYSSINAVKANFQFISEKEVENFTEEVNQSEGGEFKFAIPVSKFSSDTVQFCMTTSKQKISKKIYLTI